MLQRSILRSSRAVLQPSRLVITHTLPRASSIQKYRATALSSHFITTPYSTAADTPQEGSSETHPAYGTPKEPAAPTSEPAPEDGHKKELETKDREIVDLKDKYLRSVADFRNLQDRTKRDVTNASNFAISRFAKDLIESIDNLDRSLGVVPAEKAKPESEGGTNADLANLYSGLKMTEDVLMKTLKKHGLERFDPAEKSDKFDPNMHEATFMTKIEGKEDGTVFQTLQKGFMLNGRVLRAAKVGVVKNT